MRPGPVSAAMRFNSGGAAGLALQHQVHGKGVGIFHGATSCLIAVLICVTRAARSGMAAT